VNDLKMSDPLPPLHLVVAVERFPIAGVFTIARGSRTEAVVVTASVSDGKHKGIGECVPYARYSETIDSVVAQLETAGPVLTKGGTQDGIVSSLPAGAARNALDCALWDYRAKATGKRVWELSGLIPPVAVTTCYTLSVGTPESMYAAAVAASSRPLLKVKLAGGGDPERIAAVRRGAPKARLVVDANEAWTTENLAANAAACAAAGVELIEQPLPAKQDHPLQDFQSPVPLCADESVHTRETLPVVATRYSAINIKLDKTGGLTEAMAMVKAAQALNLDIMVGCMVGTSLAMAPAMLIARSARFVDLDGPLLLAQDREPGLLFEGSTVHPPDSALWG
jgi:L-Ala-D/L-Glu epimerase